jgi:NitT/TauT family transport system permease protein
MAELALPETISASDLSPEAGLPRPSLLTRSMDRAVPVAAVFVLLMIAWYGLAAYFNYDYLTSLHQEVNPTAWNKLSTADKLKQSVTTDQPLMPTPIQTIQDFLTRLEQSPTSNQGLWVDIFYTGRVALLGFLLGTAIGVTLALLFMTSRLLSWSLMPYVVASQTIPIVALVPAIIVTIGLGLRSEILISAYLAFFSITISTYKGLQSVQPVAFELMRSYAANPWQIFLKLRLPAALPFLFTGLRVGVTASLVGAIIAELPSGSSNGLGQGLVTSSTDGLYIPLWSTMMAAACLGLVLYGAVVLAEKLIVRWNVEPVG